MRLADFIQSTYGPNGRWGEINRISLTGTRDLLAAYISPRRRIIGRYSWRPVTSAGRRGRPRAEFGRIEAPQARVF